MDGLKVGEALGRHDFREELAGAGGNSEEDGEDGSIMVVVATDAQVGSRNLERMAKRAPLGIGRTGGYMSNGSGDFVIAFSTAGRIDTDEPVMRVERLANRQTSALFLATVEATEEAIYNALVAAGTMAGRGGRVVESLPLERVRELAAGAAGPANRRP